MYTNVFIELKLFIFLSRCFLLFLFEEDEETSISEMFRSQTFMRFSTCAWKLIFPLKHQALTPFRLLKRSIHSPSFEMLLFSWLLLFLCFCLHFCVLEFIRFAVNGCDSTSWCYSKQTKLAHQITPSRMLSLVCTLVPMKKRFVSLFVQVITELSFPWHESFHNNWTFPSSTSKGILDRSAVVKLSIRATSFTDSISACFI